MASAGSTHAYGDRQQRGFATPAEKVFEVSDPQLSRSGAHALLTKGFSCVLQLFALAGFVPASVKAAAAAKKVAAEEVTASQAAGTADVERE